MSLETLDRRRLVAWFARQVGPTQAEDLAQETCLKAWRARAQYDGRAQWSTWFYRIAVNCLMDARRLAMRKPDSASWVPVSEALQVQEPSFGISRDDLRRALRQIHPDQRAALFAIVRHGTKEASARTGLPNGTLKSRASRGRAELGRALGRPTRSPDR